MIKLYSNPACPHSHRTRIVLEEKELPVDIIDVDEDHPNAKLLQLNPYGKLPTIIDRDTVLFETSVVDEYLDERYPHPPLKPGSPAERAQMRLAVMQIENEVYPLYEGLEESKKKSDAVKKLSKYLDSLNTYLAKQQFFMGECYTLADVALTPILWRLAPKGIDTSAWPHIEAYMDRLFERPAFERSLSEYEQMLRN